jgi:hypothetical protein
MHELHVCELQLRQQPGARGPRSEGQGPLAGPELIVFWLAFSDGSITKGCLSPRRHDRRTNARHGEYRPYAAGIFR